MEFIESIHCNNCNKELVDDEGPLQPHAIIENLNTGDKKYFCLSNDECLEDMEKYTYLRGYIHVKDIAARDRSLLYPKDLVFKGNFCIVENSSIGLRFLIERKGLRPDYCITRGDTKDILYTELQGDDQLDYYLQVLNIDKVITKA